MNRRGSGSAGDKNKYICTNSNFIGYIYVEANSYSEEYTKVPPKESPKEKLNRKLSRLALTYTSVTLKLKREFYIKQMASVSVALEMRHLSFQMVGHT